MYLTQFVYNTKPKNKLQQELLEFAKSQDCILIKNADEYKRQFLGIVAKLNAIHPRCEEIKAQWVEYETDGKIQLHGTGFLSFQMEAVKQFEDENGFAHFGKYQHLL